MIRPWIASLESITVQSHQVTDRPIHPKAKKAFPSHCKTPRALQLHPRTVTTISFRSKDELPRLLKAQGLVETKEHLAHTLLAFGVRQKKAYFPPKNGVHSFYSLRGGRNPNLRCFGSERPKL